jgi:isoquinoline 1-oxidoreductase beta subunit
MDRDAPDDTVTIRIAQTELGQGVWTSNAMMVCEELQCDWTKVRPASRVRESRRLARKRPRGRSMSGRGHRSERRRRTRIRQSTAPESPDS